MASLYTPLLIMGLLPLLALAAAMAKSTNPGRVRAGIGLLTVGSILAIGVAVYAASAGSWAGVALSALAILAFAIEWDLVQARLRHRLPRLTMWLLGFRWGSSTNRRRP